MTECLGDQLGRNWWRDKQALANEYAEHGSLAAISAAHNISVQALSGWWRKHDLPPLPRGTASDDAKPFVSANGGEELVLDADRLGEINDLLRARGLDPADWIIVRAIVNSWEGFLKDNEGQPQVVPLKQLKVHLRRRLSLGLLQPATVTLPKPRPRKVAARGARLLFVYGDDQRPNVDRDFERLKLDWIRANRPDVILDLGDGMDAPTLSGHKTNPAMNWSVQECANDYASWLYAARRAAPNAEMVILPDNHLTGRLRDYQLARAAAMYGVTPADVEGMEPDLLPLWSVERLLRLDEIGVRYLAPPGDTHYAEGQYEIVPGELVALHGYRTGQNLGRKFIDDYGCSVIYGHAHGQDVYVTDQHRRGVGKRRRLYALGVGCGANLHGGGGFAPGADWQNSCLTVSVFPDGGWTWDYISYEDGVLRWRDQTYTLEAAA